MFYVQPSQTRLRNIMLLAFLFMNTNQKRQIKSFYGTSKKSMETSKNKMTQLERSKYCSRTETRCSWNAKQLQGRSKNKIDCESNNNWNQIFLVNYESIYIDKKSNTISVDVRSPWYNKSSKFCSYYNRSHSSCELSIEQFINDVRNNNTQTQIKSRN